MKKKLQRKKRTWVRLENEMQNELESWRSKFYSSHSNISQVPRLLLETTWGITLENIKQATTGWQNVTNQQASPTNNVNYPKSWAKISVASRPFADGTSFAYFGSLVLP